MEPASKPRGSKIIVNFKKPRRSAAGFLKIVKAIRENVKKILKENKADGELNIALISNQKMRSLNKKYRGEKKTTDVLSFEINEGGILGDIYISLPEAKRQAKLYKVSLDDELVRLAVHGTLHVLGYTHKEMHTAYDRLSQPVEDETSSTTREVRRL